MSINIKHFLVGVKAWTGPHSHISWFSVELSRQDAHSTFLNQGYGLTILAVALGLQLATEGDVLANSVGRLP